MRAYSIDLRERVVASLAAGMKKAVVARVFKIDRSTVHKYSQLSEEGSLAAKVSPGRPKKLSLEQELKLMEYIKTNNDLSLEEHADHVEKEFGVKLAISTVHLYCKRAGITRKKEPLAQRT